MATAAIRSITITTIRRRNGCGRPTPRRGTGIRSRSKAVKSRFRRQDGADAVRRCAKELLSLRPEFRHDNYADGLPTATLSSNRYVESACKSAFVGGLKMQFFGGGKEIVRVLFVLAVAQVIGWGTIGLLAVIGGRVAADLSMNISAVFAGNSILYVVMGLWAPVLATAFMRFGARRVLIAGTIVGAPGFVLLSVSHGPVLYFTAWVILGTAGSAMLTTAAYIMVNEIAGRKAKGTIGALMLMTG